MFNLLKDIKPTYTWPVEASIPSDNGKYIKIKFDAEFKRLDKARISELLNPESDKRAKDDTTVLAELLISIKAKDATGEYGTLPPSDEAELRSVVGIERAIVLALFASIAGEKEKN